MRLPLRAMLVAAVLALLGVRPSMAQDGAEGDPFWERSPHLGVGVGISVPTGQFNQSFDAGWDIGANVAVPMTTRGDVWVQADFNYEGQLARDGMLRAYGATGGGANITSATVNVVLNAHHFVGRLTPYAIMGGGLSWRYVELDNFAGDGYCNLFIGFCGVYGSPSVRSRTQLAPGWDAGVGLRFRIWPIRLFLEARANTIYTSHGSTTFIPVVLGTEW
jgi:hypothetical protein